MKASACEWVLKAEEDYLAATALSRRRKKPLWNIVAFHAQQAVGKYLKARLEEVEWLGGSLAQSVKYAGYSALMPEAPRGKPG